MTKTITGIGIFICIGILGAASDTGWTQWEPKLCLRQCTHPFGVSEYQRDCLQCSEKNSCNVTDPSQCDGPAKEVSSCYVANECTGDGVYTGQMSPWIPSSLCPDPKLSCTGKVRIFKRTCQRTDRSGPGEFKCPGDQVTERKEPCICGVDDPAAIAVSDPHWGWLPRYGVWSEWSEWNCQQLCVNVTRRTRQCKKNPSHLFDCPMDAEGRLSEDVMPCRIDGKPLCRNQGEEVLCPGGSCLNDWSSWTEWSSCLDGCEDGQMLRRERICLNAHAPCFGENEELKPCPRNETICKPGHDRVARAAIPINGGWTDWSPKRCKAMCQFTIMEARGKYYQTRLCINPWPEHNGQSCPGESKSQTEDRCEKECKDMGELQNDAILLNDSMVDLQHGVTVKIKCPIYARFAITHTITASFNGGPFTPEAGRTKFERIYNPNSMTYECYFEIQQLLWADVGVYRCHYDGVYYDAPNRSAVMNAVAVTMNPPPVVEVEYGGRVELDCYSHYFGDLIQDLKYIWKHNDALVGQYSPATKDVTIITSATLDNAGLWECFVIQLEQKFMTKTRSLNLVVRPPPTTATTTTTTTTISSIEPTITVPQIEDKYSKLTNVALYLLGLSKLIQIVLISYLYYMYYQQHKDEDDRETESISDTSQSQMPTQSKKSTTGYSTMTQNFPQPQSQMPPQSANFPTGYSTMTSNFPQPQRQMPPQSANFPTGYSTMTLSQMSPGMPCMQPRRMYRPNQEFGIPYQSQIPGYRYRPRAPRGYNTMY